MAHDVYKLEIDPRGRKLDAVPPGCGWWRPSTRGGLFWNGAICLCRSEKDSVLFQSLFFSWCHIVSTMFGKSIVFNLIFLFKHFGIIGFPIQVSKQFCSPDLQDFREILLLWVILVPDHKSEV